MGDYERSEILSVAAVGSLAAAIGGSLFVSKRRDDARRVRREEEELRRIWSPVFRGAREMLEGEWRRELEFGRWRVLNHSLRNRGFRIPVGDGSYALFLSEHGDGLFHAVYWPSRTPDHPRKIFVDPDPVVCLAGIHHDVTRGGFLAHSLDWRPLRHVERKVHGS